MHCQQQLLLAVFARHCSSATNICLIAIYRFAFQLQQPASPPNCRPIYIYFPIADSATAALFTIAAAVPPTTNLPPILSTNIYCNLLATAAAAAAVAAAIFNYSISPPPTADAALHFHQATHSSSPAAAAATTTATIYYCFFQLFIYYPLSRAQLLPPANSYAQLLPGRTIY